MTYWYRFLTCEKLVPFLHSVIYEVLNVRFNRAKDHGVANLDPVGMIGSCWPHGLREEYLKDFFQHKSKKTLDPQGRVSLDPMDRIGKIYAVATYQIYKLWPHGFREEDVLKCFPL